VGGWEPKRVSVGSSGFFLLFFLLESEGLDIEYSSRRPESRETLMRVAVMEV